jgi:hypothetical protein
MYSPSGRLTKDPWRGMLNFVFVNMNRGKIGTSKISGCLEGELRYLNICERFSYLLMMSKKKRVKSPYLIPWI